jgi:hypothetical protein
VERGLFEPEDRIELIDGLLVVREPQSAPHVVAVQLAHCALQRAFGAGWNVRPAGPVALDEDSEPEPDLAVALVIRATTSTGIRPGRRWSSRCR